MKIYAVSDIHGKSGRIEIVRSVVQKHRPELIVLAGDIVGPLRRKKSLKAIGGLRVPTIAVRGNSEWFTKREHFSKHAIKCLHLQSTTFEKIKFFGISGTIPIPFRTRLAWNEKPIRKKSLELMEPDSVLISHPPPLGIADEVLGAVHVGSRLVRNLVEHFHPPLVICGHIHESSGVVRHGRTAVINCAFYRKNAGVLIEMGKSGASWKIESIRPVFG